MMILSDMVRFCSAAVSFILANDGLTGSFTSLDSLLSIGGIEDSEPKGSASSSDVRGSLLCLSAESQRSSLEV